MEKIQVKALVEKVAEDGSIEAIASTETTDRDGDVIKASGWNLENFMKNPVILWSHRSDLPAIGKAIKVWVEGTSLKMQVKFDQMDEFAKKVGQKYKDKFMRAFSVGFIPAEKDETGAITKAELLEVSAVNIPANPEALRTRGMDEFALAIKSFESKSEEQPKEDNETKEEDKKEDSAPKTNDETKKEPEPIKEETKKDQDVKDFKLETTEDVKNLVRNTIDTCNLTVKALNRFLESSKSVKGEDKKKVVITAEETRPRKAAKIAYRAIESILKDLKN